MPSISFSYIPTLLLNLLHYPIILFVLQFLLHGLLEENKTVMPEVALGWRCSGWGTGNWSLFDQETIRTQLPMAYKNSGMLSHPHYEKEQVTVPFSFCLSEKAIDLASFIYIFKLAHNTSEKSDFKNVLCNSDVSFDRGSK